MSGSDQPQGGDVAQAQAVMQQLTNGYWTTQIIYVAAKLGIADLLERGPQRIDALAQATQTHPPSLYRLMRALAGLGVFRENGAGEYETTALGRCLVSGSPGALRARAILNGEDWYAGWGSLLHSVRTGETAFDHRYGMPWFKHLAPKPEVAAVFNEAMANATEGAASAVAAAYDFTGCGTIVDVGGGTGAFLSEILKANPHTRGVLFDLRTSSRPPGSSSNERGWRTGARCSAATSSKRCPAAGTCTSCRGSSTIGTTSAVSRCSGTAAG